jgi:hypothetical protein
MRISQRKNPRLCSFRNFLRSSSPSTILNMGGPLRRGSSFGPRSQRRPRIRSDQVTEKTDQPGFWKVYSGAEAVEAARRLGRTSIECIVS